MQCTHGYSMKATLVPIQSMSFVHDFDQESSMAERGKMILEYFDELSKELIMK